MPQEATTLYLRGVPKRLVREAKAAAAQQGLTLSRWVSNQLAVATGTEGAADSSSDPLKVAKAWYEARKGEFQRRYPGEYLAIIGNELVDHDHDFDRLARRVFAEPSRGAVFMPRVGEAEVRIRSPRLGSRRPSE